MRFPHKNIMERASEEYTRWAQHDLPDDLRAEIDAISGDEREIYDRFCKDMTFGTSGLRGKMGVGSNRINSVVLKRATMGVADYLLSKHRKPFVIIGYDTRINSRGYAFDVACELSKRGVGVKIFAEPTPVPLVSFAISDLAADGGIMITASHNPKEYNGYKVYDHWGNQIDDKKARLIEAYINGREYFEEPGGEDRQAPVTFLGEDVKERYRRAIYDCVLLWTEKEAAAKALSRLSVTYTPLNGTGRDFVVAAMKNLGIEKIQPVTEQWEPDGNFPTCPIPNPEREDVFALACERYCDEDTDVIIATDPDSDRMGVMARCGGRFKRLTGNQVGELMLDYVCRCHSLGIGGKSLGEGKVAYKSYVSSPLTEEIGASYGVRVESVPTGFKNIALEMEKLKSAGREDDFLFGFEESLGYLYGNYTRDKDGVLAAQMVCLMAAYLKEQGMTLFDKLEEIYRRHGYMEADVQTIEFESEADRCRINGLMDELFAGRLQKVLGQSVKSDVSRRATGLFSADMPQGHKIMIRPSGTEMKVKIYVFAKGSSREEAAQTLADIMREVIDFAKDTALHKNGEMTYE